MSTQDQSPKTEAPASAAAARDLVPYTPPARNTIGDRAETILSSMWFRGGCVVAALCVGGIVGFVSIDQRQAQLASAQGEELRELASQIAALKQAVDAESDGRKQSLAAIHNGIEQVQRGAASTLLKVNNDLDKANAARAAAETRIVERLDRLEKQTSAAAPTASIPAPAVAPKQPLPTPPAGNAGKESSVVPMSPPAGAAQASVQRPEIPVRGYVLRAVEDGVALVETRFGLREIQPGQTLPGAGRVQSIERRGRKWVVVTSEGIIDSETYR
jgi:hypothetical protein